MRILLQALVSAGATLEGKAVMDEMAFSLEGENHHYGTPPNPAAPGRIPGGSSSGSAVGPLTLEPTSHGNVVSCRPHQFCPRADCPYVCDEQVGTHPVLEPFCSPRCRHGCSAWVP